MFGAGFWAAGKGWLYPTEKQQVFWRAVGFFVLLFLVFQLLQIVITLAVYSVGFHESLLALRDPELARSPTMMKSLLIAMFPASVPTLFLGLYFAQFGLPYRQGRLPLSNPRLGVLGWLAVIFGFMILMFGALNLVYWLAKFDSLHDSGLVEKTMAEMTSDPRIFVFALPSIILAAPLAEEFLFRGVLFAGLTNTFVGRTGAVIITAALWSLAHAGPAPWINVGLIFVMGLVLGILLLRFGSLWVTIACHTAWNAMTTLAIFTTGATQ